MTTTLKCSLLAAVGSFGNEEFRIDAQSEHSFNLDPEELKLK
jgi:hypothetical protein